MSLILNIETATNICSVALSNEKGLISFKETSEENVHSSLLTVFISDIVKQAGKDISALDAVAVSKGPGSYTGLRIGVSVAKGICYALNIPLISVNTLQSLAYGLLKAQHIVDNTQWLCPMIDARRMEVYNALFDIEGNIVKNVSADIIVENSYHKILSERKIYFFGNGSEKCKKVINHHNAVFVDDIFLSAINMIDIANRKFINNEIEDTAYFEPFYLKDFVATIPKKNIFKGV